MKPTCEVIKRKTPIITTPTSDCKNAVDTNAPTVPNETLQEPSGTPIFTLGLFQLYQNGLFMAIKSSSSNAYGFERIGNYIIPIGKTNFNGVSCLLLEFKDSNNATIDFKLDAGELADTRALAKKLMNCGYKMNLQMQVQLRNYLNECNPDTNIIATDKMGWLLGNYILPHIVIGENKDIRYYGNIDKAKYQSKGTLDQWRENIAKECVGREVLELAIYAGFAGILTHFVGFGFGLHLQGKSSGGKTTALIVANSIFGNSSLNKWNATHNGIAFFGVTANHALCAIDEINEAGKSALDSIYMLVDGVGKSRATHRNGDTEQAKVKTWQTVVLSTGEISIADMAVFHGKNMMAGESTRMLNIEANAVCKDKQHSERLTENCTQYYGTASVAFIEYIINNKIDVKARFNQATNELLSKYSDIHNQAGRVTKDFALMQVAGEIAKEAGILPSDYQPQTITTNEFSKWFGYNNHDREKQKVISVLAEALSDPTRFIANSNDSRVSNNYIGFFNGDDEYYVMPSLLKSKLWQPKQINAKQARDILVSGGFLSSELITTRQHFNGSQPIKAPRLDKDKILAFVENIAM